MAKSWIVRDYTIRVGPIARKKLSWPRLKAGFVQAMTGRVDTADQRVGDRFQRCILGFGLKIAFSR
jgi:hypothetical protein